MNDGIYEYGDIMIPFLAGLCGKFYNLEPSKKKKHKAIVNRFHQ